MAESRSVLIFQDGKAYVSLDHLNTVLASLPNNPSRATIISQVNNDRLRFSLQVQTLENARAGVNQRGGDLDQHHTNQHQVSQGGGGLHGVRYHYGKPGRAVRGGSYQEARTLVKQLGDLQLSDTKALDQLLTDPHPQALSALHKAEGSLVPLATANDGRVFSVLIGSTPKSDWGGEYPTDYFQAPTQDPQTNDLVLLNNPFTPYQFKNLQVVIGHIKRFGPEECFNIPAQVNWPDLWEQYRRVIQRPMDISLIEQSLDGDNYQTIAQLMGDVDLLRINTIKLFGPSHMMTTNAKATVDLITRHMGKLPAELAPTIPTRSRAAGIRRRAGFTEMCVSNGLLREMVYKNDMHVSSTQHVDRRFHYPRFVIPLGRVCVAQNPSTEMYATRRTVVMDIASPRKALWLVGDYFTVRSHTGPYRWLPNDQLALLDINGRSNEALSLLIDDISLWDIGSNGAGGDDMPAEQLPDWDEIQVPDGFAWRQVSPSEVVLDTTWERRARDAIQNGWTGGEQSESREHHRDEQGSLTDEPVSKRLRPNKRRGAR